MEKPTEDYTENPGNSNSDNSKTSLTRTKLRFPWSKFTPITRISGSYNSPRMPIEISH